MARFEIRGAGLHDEDHLLQLAANLDSVNLPNDRGHIQRLLQHAERSFSGAILSPARRKYVFALWDLEQQRVVGTSTIVAQLGTREAPYIYLDVLGDEKYSRSLDRHFHHTVLRLGFSYDGPTELGGLVVAPELRRSPERLGLLVSAIRFLFIARRRDVFRDHLLAELLPPLEPDGTSHLWEALGRRFTGMSYAEADLLSSQDKDFIRDLFPTSEIYASLFSAEAQAVIGRVGLQTKGVEKMLRRIGFEYAERIDPFDGGPHFMAPTDEVTWIQRTRRARVAGVLPVDAVVGRGLVARELSTPPYLRAIPTLVQLRSDATAQLPQATLLHLELEPSEEVVCLPLP